MSLLEEKPDWFDSHPEYGEFLKNPERFLPEEYRNDKPRLIQYVARSILEEITEVKDVPMEYMEDLERMRDKGEPPYFRDGRTFHHFTQETGGNQVPINTLLPIDTKKLFKESKGVPHPPGLSVGGPLSEKDHWELVIQPQILWSIFREWSHMTSPPESFKEER